MEIKKCIEIRDIINDLNYIIVTAPQNNPEQIAYKEALEMYKNRLVNMEEKWKTQL